MSSDERMLRLVTERETALEALRSVVTRLDVEDARSALEDSREKHDEAETSFKKGPFADDGYLRLRAAQHEEASAEFEIAEAAHARWWPVVEGFERFLVDVAPDDWRAACALGFSPGGCSVTINRLPGTKFEEMKFEEMQPWIDERRRMIALTIAAHAGMVPPGIEETLKRVKHVGPQPVVEGVSLDDAIAVKTDLERWRAVVKIKERVRPKADRR